MPRTVLVIHGAGEPRRRRGKVYWEPLLGDALGRGYRVVAPRMPRPEDPNYWPWARRIDELIRRARRPVLVGHSFGASVLLKYFAETVRRPAVAGLFLVATPLWGPKFPEYALPPDFGARLRDLSPIYLYHSRVDVQVAPDHLRRIGRALLHAKRRLLQHRGHEFDQDEFPELVADIRRVTVRRATRADA